MSYDVVAGDTKSGLIRARREYPAARFLFEAVMARPHDIDPATASCKNCGRHEVTIMMAGSNECPSEAPKPEKRKLTIGEMWGIERWGRPGR